MGILRTDKISGLEKPTAVTGSVLFDGTGDYLEVQAGTSLGTSDFTCECWIYPVSGGDNEAFFGFGGGGSVNNFQLSVGTTGALRLYYKGIGATDYEDIAGALTFSSWNHVVFSGNSGSELNAYVNGVKVSTISYSYNYSSTSLYRFGLNRGGVIYYDGYISNLRVIKGKELYTSNFTPPTHELEVIDNTILLCCNNPDSAGAEASGKTITVNGDAAASTFSPGLTKDFTYGTEFRGVTTFDTQGYFVPPSGTTEQRGRGRGFFVGGNNPTYFSNIDTVQISSQGNAIRFGDLSVARAQTYGAANSTRGIVFGSYDGSSNGNFLEAFDTTTGADAIDFGNLLSSTARRGVLGMASNTRAIAAGGATPSRDNTIQYVTIASLGDAQEFGDLIADSSHASAATACSPTRGVMGGGTKLVSGSTNSIGYITMATTGNSVDFGDANTSDTSPSGVVSSSTRGVFLHATSTASEFITISTLGNAQTFGDIGVGSNGSAAVTNSVRGINAGGFVSPANVNTITFVNIASTGEGTDFGDLIRIISSVGGYSDSHGGVS